MSGGQFYYTQHHINDIADDIEKIIDNPDYNYPPVIIKKFMEAVKTLRLAYHMVHRIDWLLSCDDGEDTFLEEWPLNEMEEKNQLLAEKTSLDRMIASLPESNVIDRMSLEARKTKVESLLKTNAPQ